MENISVSNETSQVESRSYYIYIIVPPFIVLLILLVLVICHFSRPNDSPENNEESSSNTYYFPANASQRFTRSQNLAIRYHKRHQPKDGSGNPVLFGSRKDGLLFSTKTKSNSIRINSLAVVDFEET